MNRFTFALYFVFIASLLAAGCTAPIIFDEPARAVTTYRQRKKHSKRWNLWSYGTEIRISKVIRKWGSPHGITDDDAGSKIYIWQMQLPVQTLPPGQENRILSRRHSSDLRRVAEASSSTDDIYEFMFYTDPKGVIYKTYAKRDENPSVGSRSLRVSQEKPESTR